MKILAFADSHSDVESMITVALNEKADCLIHLGDHYNDAYALKNVFPDILMFSVKGNTDMGKDETDEKTIILENKKLLITHGHEYDVEHTYLHLIEKGKRIGCDFVLFGHTHKPFLSFENGFYLLNPGRIGRKSSRIVEATYGLIYINNDDIKCKIINL